MFLYRLTLGCIPPHPLFATMSNCIKWVSRHDNVGIRLLGLFFKHFINGLASKFICHVLSVQFVYFSLCVFCFLFYSVVSVSCGLFLSSLPFMVIVFSCVAPVANYPCLPCVYLSLSPSPCPLSDCLFCFLFFLPVVVCGFCSLCRLVKDIAWCCPFLRSCPVLIS